MKTSSTFITVRDKFNEIQKAGKNIRDVRKQLNDFVDKQGDCPGDQATGRQHQQTDDGDRRGLHQTKAKSGQDVPTTRYGSTTRYRAWRFRLQRKRSPGQTGERSYTELSAQAGWIPCQTEKRFSTKTW